MGKILAITSLILIFLGTSMFVICNFSQENEKLEYQEIKNELINKDVWKWKIPWEEIVFVWNFSEGEEMIVAVWPNYDWAVPSLEPETGMFLPPNSTQYFEDVKRLRVNVTNLNTWSFTLIEIYYPYDPMKPGRPAIFQDYFGVSNKTGALILDEDYPKAGVISGKGVIYLGKARAKGTYLVTFSMEPQNVRDEKIVDDKTMLWPHPISPPYMVRLYKRIKETVYPYRSILTLSAGATLLIIGGIAFFKSRKPLRRHLKISKTYSMSLGWV
jgi:hypothetical protein